MGWARASDIVDPQLSIMVKAVGNGELDETTAEKILTNLVANLQECDWDTEEDTLQEWTHVPWVVRAFAANDVAVVAADERPTRKQVKYAVRAAIDSKVDTFYDLSDSFARNQHADAITNAVAAIFRLDDDD